MRELLSKISIGEGGNLFYLAGDSETEEYIPVWGLGKSGWIVSYEKPPQSVIEYYEY